MKDLFKNRYRVPSFRAQWWNYGNNGMYFVTICTRYRVHYFGEISKGHMILSEAGFQCWECWLQIPNHFPFVVLDAFTVMPNHIHGIIIIDKPKFDATGAVQIDPVETQYFASLQGHNENKSSNVFGPQSQNLGSIIRGFKIGVTSFCRQKGLEFEWQPRFHDHIIRNRHEFESIRRYILNNPKNWNEDVHYL